MKKVLIITYYWIPSGGSGVQRWVKFTKYLRDFGWEPIIYAPENPEYPSIDKSFEKDIPADVEVIKKPIWEPYNIYRSLLGKKNETINAGFISEDKKSLKKKLSFWLRGNLLVPDPRVFWVKPSIAYLKKYIVEHSIDAIVTTGPPQSMHLIGLGLKKLFPTLKWIADFRDPWTGVYYFKDMHIGFPANALHKRLEKKVLKNADKVLVVSNGMKSDYSHLTTNIEVITNGFDVAIPNDHLNPDAKFSISYIGLLTERQNPKMLWKVLSDLCDEIQEFRSDLLIRLIGKIDFSALESVKRLGLESNLEHSAYIPHSKAVELQRSSQVLLLLMLNQSGTNNILTGKLFEYLAAKRPVLGIGNPEGDAGVLLNEVNAGRMIAFENYSEIKKQVIEYYNQYKAGSLKVDSGSIDKYSRKNLTAQLAEILNKA